LGWLNDGTKLLNISWVLGSILKEVGRWLWSIIAGILDGCFWWCLWLRYGALIDVFWLLKFWLSWLYIGMKLDVYCYVIFVENPLVSKLQKGELILIFKNRLLIVDCCLQIKRLIIVDSWIILLDWLVSRDLRVS
jgi:hypothetical protein